MPTTPQKFPNFSSNHQNSLASENYNNFKILIYLNQLRIKFISTILDQNYWKKQCPL